MYIFYIFIYVYIAIYIYSQGSFFTQKPISRVSYQIMTAATLFTLQLKGSHWVPALICARSFAISTLKPSMARASDEERGGEIWVRKKWLGKNLVGKLDVYIHIFVGVIFHLLPQHLSFGKLQCRIQGVMSSKLSWWLENSHPFKCLPLAHQVGSPPQKVGSYQAEFSMSLLEGHTTIIQQM